MVTLDTKFANRIIEKVKQYTDYNINIMNDRGVIVASLMKDRIGTFHEVAMCIIQGDQDEIVVDCDKKYVGTKSGVNIAVYYKARKVGVVGITGDPKEVRPIALVVRMAIETLLEYEVYKEERFQRKNLKDQFLNRVMYGENVTGEELDEYAQRLGLEEKYVRIPLIIRFNKNAEFAEKVLADIREYHYLSRQDIATVTRNNDIIIFKYFDEPVMKLNREYKFLLAESVSAVLRYLKSRSVSYTIYVGSFQKRFAEYRMGYRHCVWLRDNCRREGTTHYFYDCLNDYYRSFVPFEEMRGIYDIFRENMSDKEVEDYMSVISALVSTDYNLTEGSKKMHVHKNTLVYRLGKIRELFGMNPVVEHRDRIFMTDLCEYLTKARV